MSNGKATQLCGRLKTYKRLLRLSFNSRFRNMWLSYEELENAPLIREQYKKIWRDIESGKEPRFPSKALERAKPELKRQRLETRYFRRKQDNKPLPNCVQGHATELSTIAKAYTGGSK